MTCYWYVFTVVRQHNGPQMHWEDVLSQATNCDQVITHEKNAHIHTYIHTLHYITSHHITLHYRHTYTTYIHTYMHTVMFGSSLTDPSRPRMSVVGSPRRSPPCRRRKSLFGPRWIHHRLRSRASYFPWRTLRSREQESDLRNGLRQRVGKGQAARRWRIDA